MFQGFWETFLVFIKIFRSRCKLVFKYVIAKADSRAGLGFGLTEPKVAKPGL